MKPDTRTAPDWREFWHIIGIGCMRRLAREKAEGEAKNIPAAPPPATGTEG